LRPNLSVVVTLVLVLVIAMLRSILLVLAAGAVSAFLPADTSRGGAAFVPRTAAPPIPSKTALNQAEWLGVENQKRSNGVVIKKKDKAFYQKKNNVLRGAPLTINKILPARAMVKKAPAKKRVQMAARIPKKKVAARTVVPKKKPVVKKKAAVVKKVAVKKPLARQAKVAPAKKVAVKKAVVAKKEKPVKPGKTVVAKKEKPAKPVKNATPVKKEKPAKPVKAATPGKGKKGAEEPAAAPPKKKFIFF